MATVGTIMGLALFGAGDMTLLSGTQTSLADGLWRLLLAVLYLTVQLSALGAIGLFISTLTEQPIGATIAVLLVNVGMFILGQIIRWMAHQWLMTNCGRRSGTLRDRSLDNLSAAWSPQPCTPARSGCWPGPGSPARTSPASQGPRVFFAKRHRRNSEPLDSPLS